MCGYRSARDPYLKVNPEDFCAVARSALSGGARPSPPFQLNYRRLAGHSIWTLDSLSSDTLYWRNII